VKEVITDQLSEPVSPPVSGLPFVSVVLAVRNEAAFIGPCLGAVLAQEWPAEHMEIFVADGESTDGTPDIIRALPDSGRIHLLSNPIRCQAAGLNVAIARARGDIIVRVDGHTQIAPDYVLSCVAALGATGAACVGGRIEPVGLTPVGSIIAAVAHTAFAVPAAFHVSRTARFTDTVYLGAWPSSVLARVGGFDERLHANEDYELTYRIRRAGGFIYLSPAIRSTYFGRQTLPALARQYFRYGIGKAQVLMKHPESLMPRQLVAPLFGAGLVVGALGWPLGAVDHLLWLGMLLAYAALNLGFSTAVALREAHGRPARSGVSAWWRAALLAPAIYLTIHLAWGAGVWVGFLDLARWLPRGLYRSDNLLPHGACNVVPTRDAQIPASDPHGRHKSM
jgi:succinoglycan biosynthesis protein ExoA